MSSGITGTSVAITFEKGAGRWKKQDMQTCSFMCHGKRDCQNSEGNGTNLLDEDEAEGYVDYIYYDQHELSSGMPECDGGQVMLTELFRDKFSSTEDAIPAVLDMAYGNKNLKYVILGDGGITCKV